MTLSPDSSDYLMSLGRLGIRPGLETVRSVLAILGNPQKSYLTIQVVGTNGKGSTTTFIEAILRASGYRTGRYISPHLYDIRERVALSGQAISSELFESLLGDLRICLDTYGLSLTFFEFLTVLAFMAFSRTSCQIVVLEAGMGGRWDATTACDPIVTVLTQVALDHEQILGKGILNIFEEKVAIGRPGRPFIACLQEGDLREIFVEKARERGFIPVLDHQDFYGEWLEPDRPDQNLRMAAYNGRWGRRFVNSALTASYQIGNLSAALASLEWTAIPVSPSAMGQGAKTASNPGRFEVVSDHPVIILDGAHNVSAAKALADALIDRFGPDMDIGFFLAIHSDKDWKNMLTVLARNGSVFFLPEDPVANDGPSSAWVSPDIIRESVFHSGRMNASIPVRSGKRGGVWKEALSWVNGAPDRALVITGSLYLVGAMRSELLHLSEPALFPPNERNLSGPVQL